MTHNNDKISKSYKLPIKLPKSCELEDLNDPKPNNNEYNKASGIFYLGNTQDEGYELWLRDNDIKTHMLIYGDKESGKDEALSSLAYNAFVLGTGLCYIDPANNPSIKHELFCMARRLGREDDFLVLDCAGNNKINEAQTPVRSSNTINPFAKASSEQAALILSSLLPKDDGGVNSVFQQKALALLTALIPVLCALRDANQSLPLTDMSEISGWTKGCLGSDMSIATIRNYLDPMACVSLVYPLKNNGQTEECDMVKKFVDESLLEILKNALTSLNYVYDKENPETNMPKKQQAYLDQFGYAKGYFGAPLASISGMYGHLFNVSSGEIDMYDCLFNRRILVNLLPSLEKSPQECENIGKIILSAVKNSAAATLGDKLNEKIDDINELSAPASSKIPDIIIIDEYAAIMMPDFEVILTQARSLGLMAIIASRDYSGMKSQDAKSCDAVLENTATKLFMKTKSDDSKADLIRQLFKGKVEDSNVESQSKGDFHAFYKGDLILGTVPDLIPKGDCHMRLNKFIRMTVDPDKVKRDLAEK